MTYVFCPLQRWQEAQSLGVGTKEKHRPSGEVAAGAVPVSGGRGASATASLAGQALPTVAPVPSVGRVDAGAQEMPSEVAEPSAMEVILLPMMGRTGLSTALMAPTVAGMTQLIRTLPT